MLYRQVEDDENDDDERIVRDGGSLRVPMSLMDHKSHNELVRRYPTQRMTDALGRPAGQRPGYVFSTVIDETARDAVDEAWEERGRILQSAWRNPPNHSVHSDKGQRDIILTPKSEDRSRPADAEAAWLERGRLLREAWRNA